MDSHPSPKICPYPFLTLEVGRPTFVPCCREWFKGDYHEIEPGEDVWNGPQSQELRKRILKGDYSLCRMDRCTLKDFSRSLDDFKQNPVVKFDSSLSQENLSAMEKGHAILPMGPSKVIIYADTRCNLACPTCRKEHIFTLNDEQKEELARTERTLKLHRNSIRTIRLASDGEVFFSPWLRSLLKNCSKENYPNLESVEILTNGVLFDEEAVRTLRPGTDMIKRVIVSIDAGNAETYKKVRGGDWNRLMTNLRHISEKRVAGTYEILQFNFIVRKANYRSIPEFVALGDEFRADTLLFTDFRNWPRAEFTDFEDEAVHLPKHPEFQKYRNVMEFARNKKCVLSESVDPRKIIPLEVL